MELQEYHEIPLGAAESAPEEQPLQPLPEREVPQQEVDYRSSQEPANEQVPQAEAGELQEVQAAEAIANEVKEGAGYQAEGPLVRSHESYHELQRVLDGKADPHTIHDLLLEWEASKTAEAGAILGPEQRMKLGEIVDEIVSQPHYLQEYPNSLAEVISRNRTRTGNIDSDDIRDLIKERTTAEEVISSGDQAQIDAMMRQADICIQQTMSLVQDTADILAAENMILVTAFGSTRTTAMHQIIVALSNSPEGQHYLEELRRMRSNSEINAALSLDTIRDPHTPAISDVTIVDPTLLQMINENPSLVHLSPGEKLDYLRNLMPGTLTPRGVFVGSFAQYVAVVTAMDSEMLGEVEFNPRKS